MVDIAIENFQSLGKVQLVAEGLTVFSGPSDRGKSALLRAVEAALFNRPGDSFVRKGQKQAEVSLELGGHTVQWVKGSGQNRYQVDGTDYKRVGAKAPKALEDLGFRNALVGARVKEDGKTDGGELLRPQVAKQFDGPFLLDKSGPFLNEALVQTSRLGVLQRANRLCASDLRAEKARLTLLQDVLTRAETEVEQSAPVVELRVRVEALQVQAAAITALRTKVQQLRTLLADRVAARAALVALPPVVTVPMDRIWKDVQLVETGRMLVTDRARVQGLAAETLPKPVAVKKTTAAKVTRWQVLRPATIQLRQHRNWVQQAEGDLTVATRGLAVAQQLYEAARVDIKVCPLCDRPF